MSHAILNILNACSLINLPLLQGSQVQTCLREAKNNLFPYSL